MKHNLFSLEFQLPDGKDALQTFQTRFFSIDYASNLNCIFIVSDETVLD